MTTKEVMLHAVQDPPADATVEDGMERFLFPAKVKRGLDQAEQGKTIPHEVVKEKMAKWLK
jgi:predicted transcriptional regulator